MLLPHAAATNFIEGYKAVLLEVWAAAGNMRGADIVKDLLAARTRCTKKPAEFKAAIQAVRARGDGISDDVIRAIQSLRVETWIHLRHTTKYALLLDAAAENAYAVKALNDPLHEIARGKAFMFEGGVVEYLDQYVCDGLVLNPIYLGPGFRSELNEAYRRIKASGQFHV